MLQKTGKAGSGINQGRVFPLLCCHSIEITLIIPIRGKTSNIIWNTNIFDATVELIAIHEITAGDIVVHVALPQPQAQSQLTTSSNDSILANELDNSVVSFASKCSAVCCMNEMEAYQPDQKEVLLQFSKKGRHFLPSWYYKYPWITLCLKDMKVCCLDCQYANKQKKVPSKQPM